MERAFPSHILAAVDFSEFSLPALRCAVHLSPAPGATIELVHAVWFDPPPYFTPSQTESLRQEASDAKAEARRALERIAIEAGAAAAPIPIEEGDAAESIVRAAHERDADLIVMGTHGRRGFSRLMLGSVSERVIRLSNIPVLVVRNPSEVKRVLCPVNDSIASHEALGKAAGVAARLAAKLMVVHVTEDGQGRRRILNLDRWMDGHPGADLRELELHSLSGNAAEEILKLAGSAPADLLVIGSEHRVFFDTTVLGVTSARVARHAPCPVMVVPSGD